ncbi:uncharacterized protein Bfra_003333 [Botrytis fragariae]|uniref:Uncharacterized protein n=1 Tax=Botrytis fragariae TaxID=1964551 RepID=A0A8H6AW62_9HELO|nr:uncharacterized protein Bfra_003333 [Botrytis fragariae]KAF5874883.1 hypothetical protein Bfra_003333 [Botrytis fragariae]
MNKDTNFLNVPTSFKLTQVDGLTSPKPNIEPDVNKGLASFPLFSGGADQDYDPLPGELNILAKLTGDFHGAGLNMIFRPSWGNNRRNNVLEYNVTEEDTQFLEDIGDIFNRGLGRQRDVILKGVPYMQTIKDMLNPETGQADRKEGIPIHFESGIFLRTPPTEIRPEVLQGTISRLASIPHGTAINCQGFEPDMKKPISGNPNIKPISVLPFPMGMHGDVNTFADFFPQLNFKRTYELRIPQEIKDGDVLNTSLMLDPNQMLKEFNENSTKKKIREHLFFSIHSDPVVSKIPGGGTANIAFLQGSGIRDGRQNPGPNAHGVNVGCDYWISTVEYDVLLPEGDFSGDKKETRVVESEARKEERAVGKIVVSPSFELKLDRVIPPNTTVKLDATQIQYSQNVTLDFDEMGWPHISVATLSPKNPVPIEASEIVF